MRNKRTLGKVFGYCISFLILSSVSISTLQSQTNTVSDIDGNVYKVVAIGNQLWMAENLKVTRYSNGDAIPLVSEASEWARMKSGAYSYYDNKKENSDKYGNLYNWFGAKDAREICPERWHLPSDKEWNTMEMYLGMSTSEANRMTAWRGINEGDKLKSETFGGGSNSSGFSVLGTGYRHPDGEYMAMSTDSNYWTSTPYDNNSDTDAVLHGFLNSRSTVVRNFHVAGYGFGIRCIKNIAKK